MSIDIVSRYNEIAESIKKQQDDIWAKIGVLTEKYNDTPDYMRTQIQDYTYHKKLANYVIKIQELRSFEVMLHKLFVFDIDDMDVDKLVEEVAEVYIKVH